MLLSLTPSELNLGFFWYDKNQNDYLLLLHCNMFPAAV